ncbi:MAG: peptidase M20 family protein [halophilic archaeon J07HX5]|nr:MAG: peptidase M20 family protein [halophilic archaeon J07HX5]
MSLRVDADRLRADIEATAAFGAVETDAPDARGRTNRTGFEANRRARDYFVERLRDAGLSVTVDPDTPAVAAGSHLDSVPDGGIFDGLLGVYATLEAVRGMQAADHTPDRPITVVSFTEEEGATFGNGLLDSSVATGTTALEAARARSDTTGRTLGDALDQIGYAGDGRIAPNGGPAFSSSTSNRTQHSSRPVQTSASSRPSPALPAVRRPSPARQTMPARRRWALGSTRSRPPRLCAMSNRLRRLPPNSLTPRPSALSAPSAPCRSSLGRQTSFRPVSLPV